MTPMGAEAAGKALYTACNAKANLQQLAVLVPVLRNHPIYRLVLANLDATIVQIHDLRAEISRLRTAIEEIAGNGANVRYSGCFSCEPHWGLSKKQKEIARAALGAGTFPPDAEP